MFLSKLKAFVTSTKSYICYIFNFSYSHLCREVSCCLTTAFFIQFDERVTLIVRVTKLFLKPYSKTFADLRRQSSWFQSWITPNVQLQATGWHRAHYACRAQPPKAAVQRRRLHKWRKEVRFPLRRFGLGATRFLGTNVVWVLSLNWHMLCLFIISALIRKPRKQRLAEQHNKHKVCD